MLPHYGVTSAVPAATQTITKTTLVQKANTRLVWRRSSWAFSFSRISWTTSTMAQLCPHLYRWDLTERTMSRGSCH